MPRYTTFLIRFFIFSLPVLMALTVYTYYYYCDDKYQESINGREIYWAIKKSSKPKKVKRLLIGDSVAQQLFDNRKYNSDTLYSLTCNQAISCAGYYFLLKNFLDNNRDSLPDQVILIVNPLSLQNNLNQVFTFHYFLKPFYCNPYKQYFTPTVTNQIEKIRFYYLSQFPFIKISNWSPDFRPEKSEDNHFLAPISLEYVRRINDLCNSFHVPFRIVSPPVSNIYMENLIKNTPLILSESSGINMRQEFTSYIGSIKYLDDSLYKDEMHFVQPEKQDKNYMYTLSR